MPDSVPDIRARFEAGETFAQFLESAQKMRDFWHSGFHRATVTPEIAARVRELGSVWHLLVLNADWCGDSVNTIPYLARLEEAAPNLRARFLDRDANLDLMDAHLTGRSRSIPKVIVYDAEFRECGSWGPRPAELQQWVLEHGLSLSKEERYRHARSWYARDKGRTTLSEIADMLERCSLPSAPSVG